MLPPQSPRGFSALARLYYLARPAKTAMLRRLAQTQFFFHIDGLQVFITMEVPKKYDSRANMVFCQFLPFTLSSLLTPTSEEVKSSRSRKTLLSCTEMKMLKMSIYNKIYTLNKIQRKVDNYNTLILKLLSIHFRVYNSFYYQKCTLKSSIF